MDETPLQQAWQTFGDELYGAYAPLRESHGWVKVKCAVHLESRPSAQVHIERGKWRCFAGCGFGDVYDLIKAASKNGLIQPGLNEFPDQKRYAQEHGWYEADTPPEPSAMNPRPRTKKRSSKQKWRPPWL